MTMKTIAFFRFEDIQSAQFRLRQTQLTSGVLIEFGIVGKQCFFKLLQGLGD